MHNMQISLAGSIAQILEPLARRSPEGPKRAVALGAAAVGEVLARAIGGVAAAGGPGGQEAKGEVCEEGPVGYEASAEDGGGGFELGPEVGCYDRVWAV